MHTLIFLGLQFKHARLAGFLAFALAEGRLCDVAGLPVRDEVNTLASSSILTSILKSGTPAFEPLVIFVVMEVKSRIRTSHCRDSSDRDAGTWSPQTVWRGRDPGAVAFSVRPRILGLAISSNDVRFQPGLRASEGVCDWKSSTQANDQGRFRWCSWR